MASSYLLLFQNDLCCIHELCPFLLLLFFLPLEIVMSGATFTYADLESVKGNKATGPDHILPWVLRNYANVLAPTLTAIFNTSLREDVLPTEWKMATVIPLPKTSPPVSIEKDIRPTSLTSIAAKVFESIIMKWMDETIKREIDAMQFGGLAERQTFLSNGFICGIRRQIN